MGIQSDNSNGKKPKEEIILEIFLGFINKPKLEPASSHAYWGRTCTVEQTGPRQWEGFFDDEDGKIFIGDTKAEVLGFLEAKEAQRN